MLKPEKGDDFIVKCGLNESSYSQLTNFVFNNIATKL